MIKKVIALAWVSIVLTSCIFPGMYPNHPNDQDQGHKHDQPADGSNKHPNP